MKSDIKNQNSQRCLRKSSKILKNLILLPLHFAVFGWKLHSKTSVYDLKKHIKYARNAGSMRNLHQILQKVSKTLYFLHSKSNTSNLPEGRPRSSAEGECFAPYHTESHEKNILCICLWSLTSKIKILKDASGRAPKFWKISFYSLSTLLCLDENSTPKHQFMI